MIRRQPLATLVALLLTSTAGLAQDAPVQADDQWFTQAQEAMQARLAVQPNTNPAKNIVVMISDGNSIGTNYATRLFQGQQAGNHGDEHVLTHEELPHLALVKTYNTNAQTPDSSGTATAILSGIKTKAGVVGVNEKVNRGDCSQVAGNEVTPITRMMSEAGKSTGIVTTARLTHATPASGYASVADRNFENDAELPEGCTVPDIAAQMIDAMEAGWLDLAMGGGRRNFLPSDVTDEDGDAGARTDGQNLIETAQAAGARYAFDDTSFAAIDTSQEGPILGLFDSSHMLYEADRSGEPSLADMVEASIKALESNENGFFLEVESGRVDHANHGGNAYRALTDGVAFAEAVAKVRELTNEEDTLVIVTADHGHGMQFNGYCGRGTPILGLCYDIDDSGVAHTGEPLLADDGRPFTVIGYMNGPGSVIKKEAMPAALAMEADHAGDAAGEDSSTETANASTGSDGDATATDASPEPIAADGDQVAQQLLDRLDVTTETDEETGESASYRWIGSRGDLTQEQATDPEYLQQATIPMASETHSGEDVAVYASGPFAHLFDGTIEQNYIFHVMHHAGIATE